ncbi:MAG: type II toxin-antitoxin system prevent-host-death family antitoxin [Gammaproteobacteria bacterium]|nr:type II toxin-antitoxin system prevent-host-death family antitoxin [Gammaproteobacteria bacterium]
MLDDFKKVVAITKFKEQFLELLDQIDDEGLTVTKYGKPIVRIVPYRNQNAELIGSLKQEIKIKGSVYSTDLDWEANDQY